MAKKGYSFVMDKKGVEEIWKSAGMQAVLQEAADAKCAELSAMARSTKRCADVNEPFITHVDVLQHTAAGAVHTKIPSVASLHLI